MLEFLRTGRPGRETCEQHCWTSQQWHSTPRTPNNGETTIGESSAIFYKQVSRVQPNSCFHGLHFTRHCRLQWTKENNRSGRSRQFTANITPKNITPKNSAPGIGAARNPAIQLRFRTRIPATQSPANKRVRTNVWFGTEEGITKYDGESFTNFTEEDGLISNSVWSIAIDRAGVIWIGTLQGACRFDGKVFSPFAIPESKPDETRGVTSARIVHSIMEDSKGRMWFGTNGGVWIYDGKSLSNISTTDGLSDNNVNCIFEDSEGGFWFATHHQGVCRWDGTTFQQFTTEDGVEGTEVWSLFEDESGNIWFPIENFGVYRFDGTSFANFHKPDGLASHAIQCIYEDREGRLWLGGWLGLFRYDGKSFFSVTKNGPWQGR